MQALITARFADRLPALDMPAAGSAPTDIQFMPPGQQRITALKGDKPTAVTVDVTPEAVDALNAVLTSASAHNMRAWFDFDHEGNRASGYPKRFYWAGSDAKSGGVRCEVEWSESGAQAVRGRDYRQFSPSFFLDPKGRVSGAPLNMGGLVNEPAFRDREPLWSRDASQNPHKEPNMSEPNLAEIQAKLSAVEKENQELKAKLASSEQDQTVKAKDAEITELRGRIVKFEEVVKQHAAERAKAHVDAAIKAKRLPPQATEVHAKWQKLIEQDPANVALIESLPEVDPTGAVVKAGNASGAGAAHKSTEDRWNTATVAQ